MRANADFFTTNGRVHVTGSCAEIGVESAMEDLLQQLDVRRGGLLASSYEYPGRYKRWSIGFKNPPLELSSRGSSFKLTAHNGRGRILLPYCAECLRDEPGVEQSLVGEFEIEGRVRAPDRSFTEEERSKQPSIFSVVRCIRNAFRVIGDEHLGLYGAFGYDLVFAFEPIPPHRERDSDQRDLVLYLPDEMIVVDYYQQRAFRLQYDFETNHGGTIGLPRTGEWIDYRGERRPPPTTFRP